MTFRNMAIYLNKMSKFRILKGYGYMSVQQCTAVGSLSFEFWIPLNCILL